MKSSCDSESTAETETMIAAVSTEQERQVHEQHNLLVLATHYVVLRLAWIFKTETVLVPAFLDAIAGAGWIRGCLPILNRVGQGLSPLLAAGSLRRSSKKVHWLIGSSLAMSFPFFCLAGLCTGLGVYDMPWLPAVFLLLYTLFFAAAGINQLSYNTLQGKLISSGRRGRLMSMAGIGGSAVAMLAAFFLLTSWLNMADGPGFARIFAFNAAAFTVAGLVLLAVREPADVPLPTETSTPSSRLPFSAVWRTLREHRGMRRTGVMTLLFMCTMLLFPHYQWLGRTQLQAEGTDLMWWVLVQNGSVGFFSWLAGYCGDRWGYRIVLRLEIFAAALIPPAALGLASVLTPETRNWYMLTFFLLGLIPVTIKTLFNYVLELGEADEHPHFLSTMSLCMALPLVFSPLVGWLIDWNLPSVFLTISVLVALGGLLTFRMEEPRDLGGRKGR